MGKAGFSKPRLGRLRDVMAGYVERGEVPGLVALVSRRGELHVEALGTKAIGGGGAITRDTIFRISSMTKPITAAAAMILVEECVLRLDDPVARLLPELADRRVLKRLEGPLDDTVPAERAITLRDLLTFRLGFGILMAPPGSYPVQDAMSEQRLGQGPPRPSVPPPPDEWIRRLGALPLMHQPGAKWMYNTGSDVLGVLIARASGRPFDAFLRERLFAPLGMKDTGFAVPAAALDRLATGYWTNFATGKTELYDEAAGGEWSRPPAFPSGGGGLVSTTDDYFAFAQMMLSKGRHGNQRILSRAAVELMTADHLTPAQKAVSGLLPGYFDSHGWGFGLSVVTRRDEVARSVGTFGWDGGLGTSWYDDPAEDLVGILMTQRAWTSPSPPPVCRDFWTSVYQAIED
ncbi:MAG TPA: serine hydrolase domain-containing protein [Stellaceae bacterium]|nr:serine hydrolase domain-containing protein [Stellaceae bacterium]